MISDIITSPLDWTDRYTILHKLCPAEIKILHRHEYRSTHWLPRVSALFDV